METRTPPMRLRNAGDGMSIRLLGEIRVQRGMNNVTLPASKRTRALLGYLAATATPQPRQALCDLLWDGPDDPRAALRWSLTKLRPIVNDDGIERLMSDREHVSLSLGDVQLDVAIANSLLPADPGDLELSQLEKVFSLLHGEFLDGLDLPSCYRFHHWCLAEREHWSATRRRVLALLLDKLGNNPERALPYARAMVAEDPLSEVSHGSLVALLSKLGRRKDAQDHYDYARSMLRREIDAPLTGDLQPPVSPQRPSAPNIVKVPNAHSDAERRPNLLDLTREHSLIGRSGEMREISSSLEALRSGSPAGSMLFVGEPGIGKSRLLEYATKQATREGARVVSSRCYEAEAVRPFGCWADALVSLIDATTDSSVRRDLSVFLPGHEVAANDDGSRNRLFAAVHTLLRSLAVDQPLVMMIDDLQWIDEASSALLHYVLRTSGGPGNMLFIGSARLDEIDENPWCKRAVAALTQTGALKRIMLQPMTADEAAQFFEPGASAGRIAMALKQSGGNPLFLTELAKTDQLDNVIPEGDLDTLISDRIAMLDESERELIVFASATTRDFKPELLGAAMALPVGQLIERIDRLERRGLLKPGNEDRFDFAHDLIRQTTYRSLSQPRRQLIHRQIARALEAAAQRDETLSGELAYHAGAAGDHGLAVRALIAAGEHSLRLFANTAAIDAADRGLGHLQHLSTGPNRAHWHIALLKVKVFAAASPGIRTRPKLYDELQRAVEAAELLGLRDDDAALGWHMASWLAQGSNDTIGAQQAILRAEELTRPMDDFTRCQQLASTGRCLLEVEGDVQRTRIFLRDAERLAATLGQNFVELEWGRGLIARWDGDLAKAQESMRRALTLARLREDRWREIECLVWMAKIAVECRQTNELEAFCSEIDLVAARIGDGAAPVADALRLVGAMIDGSKVSKLEVEGTLSALRTLDDKAQLAYVLNQIAQCHLERNQFEPALAPATEALEAARAVKRTTEIVVATSIISSIHAARGNVLEAGSLLESLKNSVDDFSHLSARAQDCLTRAESSTGIPTPVQRAIPHRAVSISKGGF
ncbi:MAG: AAA family ATPase [Aestuariivirga sp.]|uniref:ATP-binding protein n=1 Tax=Aestuariivirga sp. TaxID=2650926 RepID=UPI003018A5FA